MTILEKQKNIWSLTGHQGFPPLFHPKKFLILAG